MSLVVKIDNSEKNLEFKKIGDAYLVCISYLKDTVVNLDSMISESLDQSSVNYRHNKEFTSEFIAYSKEYCSRVFNFINNKDNKIYLLEKIGGNSLVERLERLTSIFERVNRSYRNNHQYLMRITNNLHSFVAWFDIFEEFIEKQKESDSLVRTLQASIAVAQDQAKNFESAINAVNGEQAEIIYSSASTKYLDSARNYECLFYLLLLGSFLFTLVHSNYVPFEEGHKLNYILIKILMGTLVITLGTLFLRKAAHLRKLHDVAHQKSLELKALPLYLRNIESKFHSDIYKELMTKYFGKELDHNQTDKIGDLMQEQMKAGTELVKASTDLIRSKSE